MARPPEDLLSLTRALADPVLESAILAEGNTSMAGEEPGSFWVKASGASMGAITERGFVLMNSQPLLDVLDQDLSDKEVKESLAAARADQEATLMPSVESFMHALLLDLPGVKVVGHGHPVPLLPLLCLPNSSELAEGRLFPDEIVCCGPASCWVPYVDPGLPLARAIRAGVRDFTSKWGSLPKTIWLGNHGLITLGSNTKEVESAFRMAVKAARVWLALLQTGLPIQALTPQQVERIAGRPDEHYRQRVLWSQGAEGSGA